MTSSPEILTEKLALLETILAYREGQLDSVAAHPRIRILVDHLAKLDPPRTDQERAALLTGNWKLLYTNRDSFSPLDRLPGVKQRQVWQRIDVSQGLVLNLIELEVPGSFQMVAAIKARFEVMSPKRLKVIFERAFITFSGLLSGKTAVDWLAQFSQEKDTPPAVSFSSQGRSGWLEIIYLDETLRIGLGNQGSLFILKRADE
ncbi:MAG: PAP/fibrillin family protein [Gloeobacterales cyanobacterium]